MLKRIDLLTVFCGILFCNGSYVSGEYAMYVAHHGYQLHHFITIGFSIQFLISFIAVYAANGIPLHRSIAVLLTTALAVYLVFTAYVIFFSFRSDHAAMNFW